MREIYRLAFYNTTALFLAASTGTLRTRGVASIFLALPPQTRNKLCCIVLDHERGSAPRREGLLRQEGAEHWRFSHQCLHHRHGYLLRTGKGSHENDTP